MSTASFFCYMFDKRYRYGVGLIFVNLIEKISACRIIYLFLHIYPSIKQIKNVY